MHAQVLADMENCQLYIWASLANFGSSLEIYLSWSYILTKNQTTQHCKINPLLPRLDYVVFALYTELE